MVAVTDYRILDDNAYGTPPKKFSVLTNKVIDNWINYLNQLKDIAVSLRNKGNKEWMEYRSKIIALARKYNLKEVDANYSENSYNINDKTCSGSLNHNGVTLTFEYDKNNCRAYEKLSFLIYKNGLTKMDLWEKYCNNGFNF